MGTDHQRTSAEGDPRARRRPAVVPPQRAVADTLRSAGASLDGRHLVAPRRAFLRPEAIALMQRSQGNQATLGLVGRASGGQGSTTAVQRTVSVGDDYLEQAVTADDAPKALKNALKAKKAKGNEGTILAALSTMAQDRLRAYDWKNWNIAVEEIVDFQGDVGSLTAAALAEKKKVKLAVEVFPEAIGTVSAGYTEPTLERDEGVSVGDPTITYHRGQAVDEKALQDEIEEYLSQAPAVTEVNRCVALIVSDPDYAVLLAQLPQLSNKIASNEKATPHKSQIPKTLAGLKALIIAKKLGDLRANGKSGGAPVTQQEVAALDARRQHWDTKAKEKGESHHML
jgi:hypothetical protein